MPMCANRMSFAIPFRTWPALKTWTDANKFLTDSIGTLRYSSSALSIDLLIALLIVFLQTSVRLTLDNQLEETEDQFNANNSTLRHRSVAGTSSQVSSTSDPTTTNNNNQTNNNNVEYRSAETRLTVWSFTTRLISFPFAFIYDTLLSIIRFALSLIRPDPTRSE